jgi:malonate decarboxylase beta subunit
MLVEDDVAAFRTAAIDALDAAAPVTLALLEAEHALLAARLRLLPDAVEGDDAVALWARLGVADAARVPELDAAAVCALRTV